MNILSDFSHRFFQKVDVKSLTTDHIIPSELATQKSKLYIAQDSLSRFDPAGRKKITSTLTASAGTGRKVFWGAVYAPPAPPKLDRKQAMRIIVENTPLKDHLGKNEVLSLAQVFPNSSAYLLSETFWRRETANLLQINETYMVQLVQKSQSGEAFIMQAGWKNVYASLLRSKVEDKQAFLVGEASPLGKAFVERCLPPVVLEWRYNALASDLKPSIQTCLLVSLPKIMVILHNVVEVASQSNNIFIGATKNDQIFFNTLSKSSIFSSYLDPLHRSMTRKILNYISADNYRKTVMVVAVAYTALSLHNLYRSVLSLREDKDSFINDWNSYLHQININAFNAIIQTVRVGKSKKRINFYPL